MTEHAAPNHAERAHALLSASGSDRWLNCPPSARLEEMFPDSETEAAAEGTLCHELCEIVLRGFRTGTEQYPVDDKYNDDMVEACAAYLQTIKDIVLPLFLSREPYTILVEQRLDFSEWVPEGFGTGDCVIVSKKRMWVIDFKYGKGVFVPVEDNSQLKLYAFGAWTELSFAYEEIEDVTLVIVQPRMNNIASWDISLADLLAWGEEVKRVAQKAFAGEGEFKVGDHCGFCKARYTCRARTEAAMREATPGRLAESPALLRPNEVAALLPQLPRIEKWARELQEWALKQAVDEGVRYPGHKLVEGRSNRYISNPDGAETVLTDAGFSRDQYMTEPKFKGITDLEKLVGKKKFPDLLGPYVSKPRGKPTLVPEDDPRSEWQPRASADDDFAEDEFQL